jgi:hypothetical protein
MKNIISFHAFKKAIYAHGKKVKENLGMPKGD